MTTETKSQVCNECGAEHAPTRTTNPTNPLCEDCEAHIRDNLSGIRWGIGNALEDRQVSKGLMARMSDERFERFIAARVQHFNEERAKLG